MNNFESGFKKRNVKFSDEVENNQFAKNQESNPSDDITTDFLNPLGDRRSMAFIQIKVPTNPTLLQSLH